MKEIVALMLLLLTLPALFELVLVTIGALFPVKREKSMPASGSFAVVIAAHNEEKNLRDTLESIKNCRGSFDIVVVADNCTDDTAAIASSLGAKVLQRQDQERRGKGYALDYAFENLDYDYYVVVDADTVVDPCTVEQLRCHFGAGADAVQLPYTVRNPAESVRSSLLDLALTGFNVIRPKGRSFFGLSAGIVGNGFALSRETLEKVPYQAGSIVEDLEYHLKLVQSGLVVRFATGASVRALMPTQGKASFTQRGRWEGGRLRVAVDYAPKLGRALLKGNLAILEPLLDLVTLPLGQLSMLVLVGLILGTFSSYFTFLLAILIFHVAVSVGHMRSKPSLKTWAYIPVYCLWKVAVMMRIGHFSRKQASWVRTEREEL